MAPAIDIFIRTYFRDFRWLELSLFGLMAGQAWFKQGDDFCRVSADREAGWPCHPYWSRSPKAAEMQAELSRFLGRRP
jgi:hypothetical protein